MQPDQNPNQQSSTPSEVPENDASAPASAPAPQQEPVPNSAPAQPDTPQPQMVYVSRPINPEPPHISEEAKLKHEESKRVHPTLNLSEGEYMISSVRRHPIGLVPVFSLVGFILLALGAFIPFYDSFHTSAGGNLPPTSVVSIIVVLLCALVAIGGYVAVYIYVNTKFYLTNESVVQEIQDSLFAKHEQTVSLSNIEDASFQQRGMLQYLLNYGSIRLSTEGDETTYRFSYVSNPKKEIAKLNNAVEAFKNGRPVVND